MLKKIAGNQIAKKTKVNAKQVCMLLTQKVSFTMCEEVVIFQDISYGTHDSRLDIYWPRGKGTEDRCPVVVFVYGGSWGSGDKAMYALLCAHVADALQVIVCCPNYATYPRVSERMLNVVISGDVS